MEIKLEYIIFIIIVIYLSFKKYFPTSKKSELISSKKEISVINSENININGLYLPSEQLFNKAVVYNHIKNNYWLFKVVEKISKYDNNLYWVLSNKCPFELNKKTDELNKKTDELNKETDELNKDTYELNKGNHIIYHSISVVDIGDFYVYQYVDFGNSITANELIMYDTKNEKKQIEIVVN